MSISNDFLINGEYGLSSRKANRALFLDSCVQFVKTFYFYACVSLNANAFVFMYDKFEENIRYCANTLKTVSKLIQIIIQENIASSYAYESFFQHFLKKFLNDKYLHIDFDFHLLRRAQNVHMGLNYSLLTLLEYEQIISDFQELWLMVERFWFFTCFICSVNNNFVFFSFSKN